MASSPHLVSHALPLKVRMPQAFPWSKFCKASGEGISSESSLAPSSAAGDPQPRAARGGGGGARGAETGQHLRRVVGPHAREAPVARLVVLPQPGLARDQAAQAEERQAAEQLQEAALAARVAPGPRGQPAARGRPRQRLVVQGVALRVARPFPLLAQGPHAPGQLGDQPRPHLLPRHGRARRRAPAGSRRQPRPPPEAPGVPDKASGATGSGGEAGLAMARVGPGRARGSRRGRGQRRPPTWEISDSDAEGPAGSEADSEAAARARAPAEERGAAAQALRLLRPEQAVRRLVVRVDPGARAEGSPGPRRGRGLGGAGARAVLTARLSGPTAGGAAVEAAVGP